MEHIQYFLFITKWSNIIMICRARQQINTAVCCLQARTARRNDHIVSNLGEMTVSCVLFVTSQRAVASQNNFLFQF